jgi:hypothetical protein
MLGLTISSFLGLLVGIVIMSLFCCKKTNKETVSEQHIEIPVYEQLQVDMRAYFIKRGWYSEDTLFFLGLMNNFFDTKYASGLEPAKSTEHLIEQIYCFIYGHRKNRGLEISITTDTMEPQKFLLANGNTHIAAKTQDGKVYFNIEICQLKWSLNDSF